jgi:translocation and assembly module TamB
MTRRRRWPFVLLGAAVLVPLLAGVLGWRWLHSSAGEATLRTVLLDAVHGAIEGTLQVADVELDGARVHLEGLVLSTPDGEVVARLEALDATIDLTALAASRVVLDDVILEGLAVHLEDDGRGLGLGRALAVRASTLAVPSGPTAWVIVVKALLLHHGELTFRATDLALSAIGLEAQGHAAVALATLGVDGELAMQAQTQGALEGPLSLAIASDTATGATRARVSLEARDSSLKATLGFGAEELVVEELLAAPQTVRAFLPSWPLEVPVFAQGSLHLDRSVVSLRAGSAVAEVSAAHGLSPLTLGHFAVLAHDVDFGELLGGPPRPRLKLEAKGQLLDARPDALEGGLELAVSWAAPSGPGELEARAVAKGGRVDVPSLVASAPGLSLSVAGHGSARAVELAGRASSEDLARLRATVLELARVELPLLSGGAKLELTVKGPLLHPGVTGTGTLTQARLGPVAVRDAEVRLELPDVTSPLDAALGLKADRVVIAERALDEVHLDVDTHGRALEARLSTKGLGDLEVRVAGQLEPTGDGALLTALFVTSAQTAWSLDGESHVTWGSGRFELAPLALSDGAQHLAVSARLRGTHLVASLDGRHLDLARLPRAVAPAELGLTGLASFSASVDGKLPTPAGRLTATWSQGGLGSVTGLDASAEGTWDGRRLAGTARATASLGRATVEVDLPLSALAAATEEPLSASLQVSELSTLELEKLLVGGGPWPARAVLSLDARVAGTAAQPSLEATLEAQGLEVQALDRVLKAEGARVEVHTGADDRLDLEARLSSFGGAATLSCHTPWTVGELWRRLPTAPEAMRAPQDCDLAASDVDAQALAPDGELKGRLFAEGHLEGPAERPLGSLELTLAHGGLGRLTALAATARLEAGADFTTLIASAKTSGAALLQLDARVAAQVLELARLPQLAERSVSATATLFPVELAQVLAPAAGQRQPGGLASGAVKVGGTLAAPTALASATVQALRFGQMSLGDAALELTSAAHRQTIALTLSGAPAAGPSAPVTAGDGGTSTTEPPGALANVLSLTGWLELPWSFVAGAAGSTWGAAPLSLSLEAQALDLAFLSGVHPAVRLVGGRLSARGSARGTLASPHLEGDAAWSDGRLALFGYGDYRDVQLAVHATDSAIDVKTLKVRSGAGEASLTLAARRQAGTSWGLEGSGALERFPIVADDQLVGTASLQLAFTGSASDSLVALAPLKIPKAELLLPEVKGKNLQGLARPTDVFVRGAGHRAVTQAPTTPEPKPEQVLRVVLDAPANLWVRGTDLDLELGLSEGFTVTQTDGPQLNGVATVKRGTISVIGRKFTVGRRLDELGESRASELRFSGPPTAPDINVTAVHVNEKEKVTVTVSVIGRGTDVAVKTSSEPAMAESDIYTLLATGRRELRRGSNASMTPEDAVSVVGQLAAAQLKTVLARKLPIDVLSFETSDNFQKLKFDVGKYLSDTLYLGVSAQSGANPALGENPWAGRLEYQMTRQLSLEGYAGTAPAAGVDFVWSRDY